MRNKLKVLHVVGGLPSEKKPHYQPFVKSQIDSIANEGIETVILEIRGYDSIFNYYNAIFQLRKIVRKNNINLIHAHYSYSGLVSLLANMNVPIVLSLMGSDLLGRPDANGKITLRGKFDKSVANFVAKRVDHLIVKSEQMKNQLHFEKPVTVIPNGVDFNTFKPFSLLESRYTLKLPLDEFVVLFLGDPSNPRKNYNLAKQAVNMFKKTFPHSKIQMLTPYGVDQMKVVDYMNAANVLLLTSYWEGSPNIIKEAMACNLPIISTNVGDVSEIIKSTYNCFIVEFSENDIVNKLQVIHDNLHRSNGIDNVKHLDIRQIAVKVIEIYKELISYSPQRVSTLQQEVK